MSTGAPTHDLPRPVSLTRGVVANLSDDAAPCAPMAWLRGRLLALAELPPIQRLAVRLFRIPPLVRVEPEGEVRVFDFRNVHYNRARGAARCRDGNDYLLGLRFESEEGAETHYAPTFSRPRHPAYREQEERDAALYTGDLRECVDMTLAAENARLRRKVALYEEFIFGVGPVLDECDDLVRHLRT